MQRADRELQLLEVAAAELGTRGYAHASMDRIAEGAGVTKPLLYNYFGSKDGLAVACIDRAGTRLVDAVAAAQTGPVLGRVTQTLSAIFRALDDSRYDWAVLYDATLRPDTPPWERARKHRRALARLGAQGVREVVPADGGKRLDADLATHLWFNSVSAAVGWWLDHPKESADDMERRLARITAALAASLTEAAR
jgi:AcrR family transcriptional regulator